VIVYAESSAILAWLLGEPSQTIIIAHLRTAETVVASSLTGVECARGLARARDMGRISATDELAALRLLDVAESSWHVHDLSDEVLQRARMRFPREPVRTLDALHLATVLAFQEALGETSMLSFDARIRENAHAIGIVLLPES
jgi:predicted nucleic acid-binding protein